MNRFEESKEIFNELFGEFIYRISKYNEYNQYYKKYLKKRGEKGGN